mmetsp:Transcript_29981/g.96136  ORF Transcript_29981/g.96136 Transcript_29981/m.96136 type:complete len:158 (-) Transcript_29981:1507-1980(-)
MRLFGKKKDTQSKGGVSPEDAIKRLNETAEMLRKRQAFLQHQIDGETEQIKKLLKEKKDPNNRKKAQTVLKKRKLKEKSVDTLERQIMNLETQVLTLQEAVVGVDGYKAQRVFTDAMKKIHEGMYEPQGGGADRVVILCLTGALMMLRSKTWMFRSR